MHKHTDMSISCLCVDLISLDKSKMFASLLKVASYKVTKNLTSNPNSIH